MIRNQTAFSLVELMVVMAIILVLGSMLSTAVVQARRSAQKVACISNTRQLGLASQMYWDDHHQRMFPYSKGRHEEGIDYWFGWLGQGAEGTRRLDHSRGALWSYLDETRIGLCPAFQYHSPDYKPKAQGASFGYGYNWHLAADRSRGFVDGAPRTLGSLATPSQTVLFADAAQINDFQSPASPEHPMIEEFYYVSDGPALYANGHFRHAERAVMTFCDGHVGEQALRPETQDMRLPKAVIGRLDARMLLP